MSVAMTGRSTGPTTVELSHPSGAVIRTTAPLDNGGDGSSFSPTDLCAASLGACAATIVGMYAANHGIPLKSCEFTVVKDMAGPPRRIGRITLSFVFRGDLGEGDYRRLVTAAKTCPVRLTLGDNVEYVEEYRIEA